MKKQRPSKAKAKEMLHNPPGGKFASDKQRRFFAWLANKQTGGPVVDPNGYLESNSENFEDQMIIPGGNITTDGMAFPIMANGQPLYPNTGDYQFDTPYVVEEPMMLYGGRYRNGYQQGGTIDPRLQQGQNYDRNAWGMYDNASYFVEQGNNPLQNPEHLGQAFISQYGQQGRDIITGISMFNQDPSNMSLSPEERLRKFYSQKSNNPELERLRMMGVNTTDPYGAYKRSNNVISQGQYTASNVRQPAKTTLTVGGKFRN